MNLFPKCNLWTKWLNRFPSLNTPTLILLIRSDYALKWRSIISIDHLHISDPGRLKTFVFCYVCVWCLIYGPFSGAHNGRKGNGLCCFFVFFSLSFLLFYDLLTMAGGKISSFTFTTVLFLESGQKFIYNHPYNSNGCFHCLSLYCLC